MQITVHMIRSNIRVLVVPSYDGIHSVRETLLFFGLPDPQICSMQRPLEALWRTFSNDRAKYWDSQDKHEAEALQGSNVKKAPDTDGSEVDFNTSRLRPRRIRIPRVIIIVFCCIVEAVLVIFLYEVGKGLLKSRPGLLTPVPESKFLW